MKIGFIGAGKVGIALAYALRNKGFEVVTIADLRGETAFAVARHYLGDSVRYTMDNMEVVGTCNVVAVTTQDGAIREVAEKISEASGDLRGKLFFHTSGAHPSSILKALDEKGALIGSLHPLQTFPDVASAIRVLPSTFIFVEGPGKALRKLEILGRSIGRSVVPVEENNKVYYHLCAVFVCNLLCALLYSGENIMKKIDITLEPFFPIIDATLNNIKSDGPLLSLTGPIVRGDIGTVKDHMEAMTTMNLHKKIYRALSLTALDMVKERNILTKETIDALARILEDKDE